MPRLNIVPFQFPAVPLLSLFGFFLILQATASKATCKEPMAKSFQGTLQAVLAPLAQMGKRRVDAQHLGMQDCRIRPLGTVRERSHSVSQLPLLIEQLCLGLGHPQF